MREIKIKPNIRTRLARVERYINEEILTMRNHCSMIHIEDFINIVGTTKYNKTGTYGLKHQLERESRVGVYCSDVCFRWVLLHMMLDGDVIIGIKRSGEERVHKASLEEVLEAIEYQMANGGMTKCWVTFRLNKI